MNPHRESPAWHKPGSASLGAALRRPAPWWRILRALLWSRDHTGKLTKLRTRFEQREQRLLRLLTDSDGYVSASSWSRYLGIGVGYEPDVAQLRRGLHAFEIVMRGLHNPGPRHTLPKS